MSELNDDNLPELGTTRRDRISSWLQAFGGFVPYAGPIIARVIGDLIPQQRTERIEQFLRLLDERLRSVEKEALEEKLQLAGKIDLFEEGAFQSARSLSEERLKYIATLVATGITGEEKEEAESKRLLNLLASITDDQIIILASYLNKNRTGEFREIHQDILFTPFATLGSSQDEVDESTVSQLARNQLASLGLLRPNFSRPRREQLPEFDPETGMMKANGYQLTPIGRLLLRRIELAENDDF